MRMLIAIFTNLHRPSALAIVRRAAEVLCDGGHTVHVAPEIATRAQCGIVTPEETLARGADLVLSIGGDGTMMRALRAAAPYDAPVLGINAGALGFLTELTPEEFWQALPQVLAGQYTLEPRMMLTARIERAGQPSLTALALNDIVVRQGSKGRIVYLTVQVAGHHLGRFAADGLIVSSPSGSTAYGLSAGGPIVHPAASVMVLVPICPHSLSFRPMIIPATDAVEILCEGNQYGDEMMVNADGEEPVIMAAGDRVVVAPAERPAHLVKLGRFSFYDRLREKLHWGGGVG